MLLENGAVGQHRCSLNGGGIGHRLVPMKTAIAFFVFCFVSVAGTAHAASERQLERWLKRFPEADTNNDGRLSQEEASAYRQKLAGQGGRQGGAGKSKPFTVDPGWEKPRFPAHAVCYMSPSEIKKVYAGSPGRKGAVVTSYPKPTDGGLRIVGTGHSFMVPGCKTLPLISRAAGFEQPLLTHTGGGVTGSARYKWELENGIFQFDRKPTPKLLASISNAKWDAMTWGPYDQDRPAYYQCWIDFCLKYNPGMKFYLSDAWPQLHQFEKKPTTDAEMTYEAVAALDELKDQHFEKLLSGLKAEYRDRVFIMPTSDAMVLAVKCFHEGKLPGIEGVHKLVGGKEKSLWRDARGHLGPGLEYLEGYVFFATIYARSPELIRQPLGSRERGGFPSVALDRAFRKIAWEAVVGNPLSGVTDANRNGIGDRHEPGMKKAAFPAQPDREPEQAGKKGSPAESCRKQEQAGATYDPLALSDRAEIRPVDFTVHDAKRKRDIPIRVYLPPGSKRATVVLFSHGLGGSRKGSAYLGKHWAARGYAAVFLQHPGSDESVWKGKPLYELKSAMQSAASFRNFTLRVADVPAALDQLEAWSKDDNHALGGRLELKRVGMSGHSFGAITTQAVSGQRSGSLSLRADPRIRAAVAFSPSTPSRGDPREAFGSVRIPWMLMTGTKDNSPFGRTDAAGRRAVYPALRCEKYELVLHDAQHSAFADRALPGERGNRNPNHHRAILALSTAFWDAYLGGNKNALAWLQGDGARAALEPRDLWQFASRNAG